MSLQFEPSPVVIVCIDIQILTIFIIKQDIHIYVAYSQQNGWTDWAEFFLWTLMDCRGVLKLIKSNFF